MSNDFFGVDARETIQIASVNFTASAGRSSISLVAAIAGQSPIIHQVACAASVWANFVITQSTAAGTAVWTGLTGNTPLVEPTYIKCAASTILLMNATGVGADAGNGFIRILFSLRSTPTSGGASIGNL